MREGKEIEIIDIKQEDEVINSWEDFIYTHHYSYHRTFFETTLGKYPRRSCEATFDRLMNSIFLRGDKGFKEEMSFSDIYSFLQPLLEDEIIVENEEKKYLTNLYSESKQETIIQE